MTITGAGLAAALAVAALFARHAADRARACALPSSALAAARDTASFCAESFVERNGYTELPGISDREMIALESWDRGRTLTDAVESRRRTLARGPVIVCERSGGFSVVFRAYDPMDAKSGHVVMMNRQFNDMRLLAGFTRIDAAERGCERL